MPATTVWGQLLHRRWHRHLLLACFSSILPTWARSMNQTITSVFCLLIPLKVLIWLLFIYKQLCFLTATLTLPLCRALGFSLWHAEVLFSMPSHATSALPPLPHWGSSSCNQSHAWAGVNVDWVLLNESLSTSYHHSWHTAYEYAYVRWLLTNCKAGLQCQSAAATKLDFSLHL